VRGRRVIAEALLPAKVIRRRLHTTALGMSEFYLVSASGAGVPRGVIERGESRMLWRMFGSHLSIAGGLYMALLAAERLNCQTVQVFTNT
jgi:hypothetical protein